MSLSTDFESQKPRLNELGQLLRKLEGKDPLLLAKKRDRLLAEFDVYRWFIPQEYGGYGWDSLQIVSGYLELSQACLATAFVLTQRSGAVRRLVTCENNSLKERLLPDLASGDRFTTVGISHLTTSRRHLDRPVLRADHLENHFRLNGFSPWVTGVSLADSVVVGASCEDGTEILIHVETDLPGVSRPEIPQLVALTDSCTGEIRFDDVSVSVDQLVGGPQKNIMSGGSGGNTGGLQTSTLAIGLAKAAIGYMEEQAEFRTGFDVPLSHLKEQWEAVSENLFAVARGSDQCSNEELRTQANSLVLRCTQSALMVAKGAGYCEGHPVGRWCREALFFLVWSCPQPVADSNLCELAQISN